MCVLWHTTLDMVALPDVVSQIALAIMSALVVSAGVVAAFGPAILPTAKSW